MRRLLLLILALLALVASPIPARADGERLFAETGWSVGGRLLQFWDSSGGLATFGLPTGPQAPDGAFQAQRFERARLELHPDNSPPYDVLLGRLGADLLAKQGRDARAEPDERLLDGPCRPFPATGREVCGPFLSYWQSHGLELGDPNLSEREALALFGLPVTGTRTETNPSGDTVITQWFERARFEWHPANPEPYRVLLGRLGAELYGEAPPASLSLEVLPGLAAAQGSTLTLRVRQAEASAVGGRLGDAPVTFVRSGNTWIALAAVGALLPPGPLPLEVQAQLLDGRVAAASAIVTVRDAAFPIERVDLPPAVQQALDSNEQALAAERAEVNAIWPVVTPEQLWDGPWQMPAEGRFTSRFGPRRSYNGEPASSYHEGLDIRNTAGSSVVAPARGRVVLVADNYVARGGAVILDHGLGVHTGYWHMEQVLVQVGQMVEPGDRLGLMGARGMATGPHLHWELHVGAASVNPEQWLGQTWPLAP